MPSEVRFVMFQPEEVRAAVIEYLARRLQYRVDLDIARVELGPAEDGPQGRIHFRKALGLPVKLLRSADLLEAMLAYCHARRIPMPLRGLKGLEITDSNLVMSIRKS